MSIEKDLINSILKLTVERPVSFELINKDANLPSIVVTELLQKLQREGLVYVQKPLVKANTIQRLELAVHALKLGADMEHISGFLSWKEFEDMVAAVLERNEYATLRNLRFKHGERRWEVDVIGCKKPLIICIDCKHWRHRLSPSNLERIVSEQIERTSALAKCLPASIRRITNASWSKVALVPAVVTLIPSDLKLYKNVPVVPVFQLQDFLRELPAYANSLYSCDGSTYKFDGGA